MKTIWISGLLTLLAGAAGMINAQEIPKFGKVADEELQMTSIPEDPEADAVWLFDRGDIEIISENYGYKLKLKQHGRVKILTEKGKAYADFRIPYWHEDRITSLKAHTVLPDGKKIKLEGKNIHDEQEKNWKYKVFAIPGVEVGAVIEYELEKLSDYVHMLEPWYFQNPEFTRLSQYSVIVLSGFSYNVFFRNTFEIEPEVEDVLKTGINYKLKKYTWTMRNLPPVKEEPYMKTLEDYRAALHFQLIAYKDQYQYIKFIDSWPELVKKQRDYYNKYLNEEAALKELLQGLNLQPLSDPDKIKTLYNYVRENIVTTSRGSKYVETEPGKVLKELKGTGAEKNILLVNLLNIVGFNADPLLLSTRSNGKVWENSPMLDKFNYVLAYVQAGINTYVMDTRDKYCPFGMLPVEDLVETGLLIDEGEGKFIKIPHPRTTNMIYCNTTSELSPEGDLRAASRVRYEGYRAIAARNELTESEEKKFIEEALKESFGEVAIDSFEIQGKEDLEAPLSIVVHYRVPAYAQASGNMLYLSAPILNRYKENPFKREKRYFPVEFPYNIAESEDLTISLPEGFQVMEHPQAVINRQTGKLTFMNNWKQEETTIKLQRQFMRQQLDFPPREYQDLRRFYDSVVQADQGQIVLSRAEAAAEGQEQ